jgi:hypothetical protein
MPTQVSDTRSESARHPLVNTPISA